MVNEKTVEVLANTLKIDASVLKAELTATGEPKISDHLTDKEVFLKSDLDALKKNIDHIGYEKGKLAGVEMEAKTLKEKYGLKGQEGIKTIDDIIINYTESKVKELKVLPDEAVKQLKSEKEALQKSLVDYDGKYKQLESTFEQYKTNQTITSKVDFAISNITIDADDTLVSAQREMLKDQFLKTHKIQVIDGKEYVVNSIGEKLVDKLMNPVTVGDALKDFAPKYVRLKTTTEGGRGGSSSQNTQLSGDLAKISTKEDFNSYIKGKGINPMSNEAMAILKEVRSRNPDFK